MVSSGGSGFTSHRQRSRRTGCFGSLQHPSRVQLCPQPLHQRKRRLKTLALFLFFMQNPENWHQPKVVHVCCAVTVYDVCVFCFFLIFFCHFIRCDSQPGAADSLRAPAWLLLIFTHPLRASCAARRGLGSNQHWHSHRDYLSLFAGEHADWGQGQTEGQEMGETHGLSSRAVRLSVSYIQFGDITGHAGLCHNSSGYGWSVLWSLWTTLNIVCCLWLFLKTLSSCVRLLL